MVFHSQHEIEKYLNHFFHAPGFFLEIGCWDGELISQTAWLEREKCWMGLCVDPFPKNFDSRNCWVCEMAVSGSRSERDFVKVSIDRRYGGDVSYFSGFKDAVHFHWDVIQEHCDYEILQVETITMADLYEHYNLPSYIEFLSVDTEGSELEIFESIDFNAWHFGMIVFEHNMDELVKQRIGELLSANGYGLVQSLKCDDIYASRQLLDRHHKAWLDNEYWQWVRALQSSTVHNFKDHPMVQRMLGNIDASLYADLVDISPLIERIDAIGREPGPVSGTCLRMLYYARKVLALNSSSIVEIGGGVGQFYALLRAIGYEGNYMILDLPEVQAFQLDYLAEVSRQTGLWLPLTPRDEYETCVSFYALGEFDDELKAYYIESVIKKCRHGFILWNPHGHASKEVPFECTITDETPSNHPDCKQLEW